MNKSILFISSVFGLGYIKFAPGTFGSLAGVLLWVLFIPQNISVQIYCLLAITAVSIIFSMFAEEIYGEKDDGRIVIDEVAGIWFSVAFLPKTFIFMFLGFLLFRIFDIKKPFIINKMQTLDGGLGITADDVLAGIIVNIILQILKAAFYA
jgi:phosphatidylglycerophosphatase A